VGAAAIGVALAVTRRKKDRWTVAKQASRKLADRTGDLAGASKDIFTPRAVKVVEEATELWSSPVAHAFSVPFGFSRHLCALCIPARIA
jgi:hypothetical protein